MSGGDTIGLIAVFGSIYLIIKAILDNRTRNKLIEKGLVDEKVKYLFAEKADSKFLNSLKWGMVLIGLGLAVLLGELVQTERSEEITIGAMFVFAGLAMLIHYGVANRLSKKSKANGSGQAG